MTTLEKLNALNENETAVMKAVIANAVDASGGDFAFTDEVEVEGLTFHQVGGYLTALAKKDCLVLDGYRINGDKNVTQIYNGDGGPFTEAELAWAGVSDE